MELMAMKLKSKKDKYQQLKPKTDTRQQFADVDFDSMLQQLANKIVNDSRLLSIIESSLTDLVFQQKVIGIKYYSIKLTPEYLWCKLSGDRNPIPDLAFAFTKSQNDFTMLLKSNFPETRHLPNNAAFGELLPQFHDLLMKRLAEKISDAGYRAKYHWFFDYIKVK